jgi:antitoxin (DNA-binding transcriptional repressor) of toxin-antitoxin stability system
MISRAAGGERFVIRRRDRPVAALIGVSELQGLERLSAAGNKFALALGQSEELVAEIDEGEARPAMAAFSLWEDEDDLEALTGEIYANRRRQGSRREVKP